MVDTNGTGVPSYLIHLCVCAGYLLRRYKGCPRRSTIRSHAHFRSCGKRSSFSGALGFLNSWACVRCFLWLGTMWTLCIAYRLNKGDCRLYDCEYCEANMSWMHFVIAWLYLMHKKHNPFSYCAHRMCLPNLCRYRQCVWAEPSDCIHTLLGKIQDRGESIYWPHLFTMPWQVTFIFLICPVTELLKVSAIGYSVSESLLVSSIKLLRAYIDWIAFTRWNAHHSSTAQFNSSLTCEWNTYLNCWLQINRMSLLVTDWETRKLNDTLMKDCRLVCVIVLRLC